MEAWIDQALAVIKGKGWQPGISFATKFFDRWLKYRPWITTSLQSQSMNSSHPDASCSTSRPVFQTPVEKFQSVFRPRMSSTQVQNSSIPRCRWFYKRPSMEGRLQQVPLQKCQSRYSSMFLGAFSPKLRAFSLDTTIRWMVNAYS